MSAVLTEAFAAVPVLATICATLCVMALLFLCGYIVHKTGKTEGLKHLAEVIKAFWRGRR